MLLLRSKTKVVKKFTICLKSNWLETRDGFTSQLTWFISKLRSPPSTFLFHEWIWKDYRPIWVLDRVHFRHPTFRRVPVRIQWTPAALLSKYPLTRRKATGKEDTNFRRPTRTPSLSKKNPAGRNGKVEAVDTWRGRFDIQMTKFGDKSEGVPSNPSDDNSQLPIL